MGTMVWTTPDAVRLRINRGDVFAVNGHHKGSKAGPADYWGGCAQIDLNVGGEAFGHRDGFCQHLSLYEAEEVIEGEGVRVRCFVASDRDVLALEIDDRRPEPQALRVDLPMWRDDVVVNGDHTARYEFEDLPGRAAVVQTFAEADYHCASAVAVQMVGEGEVEITRSDRCRSIGVSAGSGKRTILIASAASWDGDTDLLTATVALLDEAARRTYADLRAAHISWWAELWSRTFVEAASDPSIEPLGCIGMALNEALVQSVSASPGEPEVIRLFPAWPQAWNAVFRLLVRGGFLVSASVEPGRVEFVEIESRLGESCRMRNPWDRPCQLREGDGPSRRLVGVLLQFETLAGSRYLLFPEGALVPSPLEITAEPATGSVSCEFTLPGGTTAGGTLGRP